MRNSFLKVAPLCATFLFSATLFAQTKPFSPKISTPATQKELVTEEKAEATPAPEAPASEVAETSAPSTRKLHQHSFGVGLGETFLMGRYGKYGEDQVTLDLFYAYAASYSFDVLVNAHWSEHEDDSERMRVMGLTGSIKSRLFEFDNFSPFILGGLGFYAPKARRNIDGDLTWSEQNIVFGVNAGGGVDLRLNDEWTVGALGQLHWPFKSKQDDQSDLKGYYFKLLLTLAYSF